MANNIFVEGLRVFTGTLTDNDLLHIKVKRRSDMPADEDMGVRYSSFINMLNLGRFALKAGDNITGDFVFSNNRGIFGKTVAGASRVLIKVGTDDKIAVGTASSAMKLFSLSDIVANVNNVDYTMFHAGNSNLASIDWRARDLTADRNLLVNGSSNFGSVVFRNGSTVSFKDSGNVDVSIITTDAAANITVGNAGKTTTLIGTSLKYGTNTILHTGNYTGTLDGRYVLKTQTVNSKPLSGNIVLNPADVGAVNKTGDILDGVFTLNTSGVGAENPHLFGYNVFKLGLTAYGMNLLNSKTQFLSGSDVWSTNIYTAGRGNTWVTFSTKSTTREVDATDYLVKARINMDDGSMYLQDGTKKVFHQGFLPTAVEVGALPITGGIITGQTEVREGNFIVSSGTVYPTIPLPAVAAGTPKGMYMGWVGESGLGEYPQYTAVAGFNTGIDTTRHFQLAAGIDGSTFYLRTAYPSSGTASGFYPWRRIYTDGNKPTAADVGLGVDAQAVFAGVKVTGQFIVMRDPASQGIRLVSSNSTNRYNIFEVQDDKGYFFYVQRTNSTDTRVNMQLNGSMLALGDIKATGRVYVNTGDEVYSPVNKPTATDLGFMKDNVATVTTQDWDSLTQSGTYLVSNASGANFPAVNGYPTVYNYGTLLVMNTGSTTTQMYISDNSSNVYTRCKFNTNPWRAWSSNSGDTSIDIRTSVDLNDFTVGGTYNLYKATGVVLTNAPSGFDYGTLQVIGRGAANASFVTQILTSKGNGSQMIRTRNDGSMAWIPWVKIYSESQKPTAADVGLSNVPNTVHTSDATASTVPVRDASGDIHARLFRSQYADQTTISGGLVFRINNSTDNYLRVCTDKGAIRDWLGVSANSTASQNWADIINKGVVITGAGVAEMGKFIDMRDTNSNLDYNVRLSVVVEGVLGVQTNMSTKYLTMGCRNDTWASFGTDATKGFLFDKGVVSKTNFSTKEDDGGNGWSGHFYCEPQGGAWVDWQARKTALQVSCPNNASAYPIWRASQWGARHLAAMEAYAGGSNSSEPTVVLHVGGTNNAFTWFQSGDFTAARNGDFNDVYIRSDASLKKNLKPLENSLAGVLQLSPQEYDKRRVDTDVYDMHEEGLIAQAVEGIFPNAVHTDPQTGLKSLKPYALIARLIGAIQEQQVMIDELKKKVQ